MRIKLANSRNGHDLNSIADLILCCCEKHVPVFNYVCNVTVAVFYKVILFGHRLRGRSMSAAQETHFSTK